MRIEHLLGFMTPETLAQMYLDLVTSDYQDRDTQEMAQLVKNQGDELMGEDGFIELVKEYTNR